jgi:hypothetical protein
VNCSPPSTRTTKPWQTNPQSFDFLYRVNRRRDSAVLPDLSINRLATWSVGQFVLEVQERVLGEVREDVEAPVARTETYACILELDINTVPAPEIRVLPGQELPRLFGELVDLGIEIATHGDVRP